MARPTLRGGLLFCIAFATYLAARVLGTWELYLIALALAAMCLVAWVLVAAGSKRLTVTRRASPDEPVAGDALRLSFTVTLGRRVPGLRITLDGATGPLPGFASSVEVEERAVRRRRPVEAGPVPAQRGVYRLPAFTAFVEDPLGLAGARRPAGAPLRLTIAPRLAELSSCAPCGDAGPRHGGGRRRLPTRDAWEFRGIRPHVSGEPLNRVDWKSTAKTGSLMLREMEADTESDLTVLLDGSTADGGSRAPAGAGRNSPDAAFEAGVVAAGSMAAFALRGGHSVSLLLPHDGWHERRLTRGAAGRRSLLTALAETGPRSASRLGASMPALLGARSRTRRPVLAVVTPQMDEDLVRALVRLRRQGVTVSVIPVFAGADGAPAAPAALVTAGVRYCPVLPGDDLRAALAARTSDRPAVAR
jgi:uncharacterized protein (DUF58 family)